MLIIRITEKQEQKLREMMLALGFRKKSEYIRSALFKKKTIDLQLEKVKKK